MKTKNVVPTLAVAVTALIAMGIGCLGFCSLMQHYRTPTLSSLSADNGALFWLGWLPCFGIWAVGLFLGIAALINSLSRHQ